MDFHFLSLIFCYSFLTAMLRIKQGMQVCFWYSLLWFYMILFIYMSENYFRLVSDKLLLVYATA